MWVVFFIKLYLPKTLIFLVFFFYTFTFSRLKSMLLSRSVYRNFFASFIGICFMEMQNCNSFFREIFFITKSSILSIILIKTFVSDITNCKMVQCHDKNQGVITEGYFPAKIWSSRYIPKKKNKLNKTLK